MLPLAKKRQPSFFCSGIDDCRLTVKNERQAEQSWCKPLIPELRRQRQADLGEFKASLVYKS